MNRPGKVYLVGAGPGDPELITRKGARVLGMADVVLYDNLANPALLALAPPAAIRVYVGKKRAAHHATQDEISALLVEHARMGRVVVRLKGGDPFIFGRGGEELEVLADAGIAFEVVPGVTTPNGIAAYCGIPLTHRSHTSVVTLITGHDPDSIDWDRVGPSETLVVFMGLNQLGTICQRILERGRPPDTPAVAVRWATRPDQETIAGTLATLPELAAQAALTPPATIVIGPVVNLRHRFNWFERLPLFGRRVLLTRGAAQSEDLAAALRSLGADPLSYPVISIEPPASYAPLDEAIGRLASYDWVVFTSVNGVRRFMARLDESDADLRSLRARICAIGPATGAAVGKLHLKVDAMPAEYIGEAVADALARQGMAGKRVLLPRAAVARDVIPETLREMGAVVDVVETYRTVVPDPAPVFPRERPHWATFTSSSTVKNFLALAGHAALEGVRVASIGPVTSETARRHGVRVDAEARVYTMEGLVAAILAAEQP